MERMKSPKRKKMIINVDVEITLTFDKTEASRLLLPSGTVNKHLMRDLLTYKRKCYWSTLKSLIKSHVIQSTGDQRSHNRCPCPLRSTGECHVSETCTKIGNFFPINFIMETAVQNSNFK